MARRFNRKLYTGGASIAVALSLLSAAAPATAQPVADGSEVNDSEIVVTALRRASSVQDAPAAITALSGSALLDQQRTSIEDLSTQVPSVNIGQAAGVSFVGIRGISIASTTGGVESPVAVHLDGAYLAQTTSFDFLMLDLASVEVLRGPQGTLYGRNATGGAINFISRKPGNTFEGHVDVSYDNYNRLRGEAAATLPLADGLAARFAVLGTYQKDGYAKNLVTGNDLGEEESIGARGTLRYEPSDALTIDGTGFYYRNDTNADFYVNRRPVGASAVAQNPDFTRHPQSTDPRRVFFNTEPDGTKRMQGGNVAANVKLSDAVTLKSRTSYTDLLYKTLDVDCDATATLTCTYNRDEQNTSFQQELNLQLSLLDDRLDWLFGGFYNDEKIDYLNTFPWNNPSQGFVSVGGFPIPNGLITLSDFSQKTRSLAAFTDATFRLSERFELFGGVRWSEDRRRINLTTGLAGLPGGAILGCQNQIQRETWDNVSGRFGAQYRVSPRAQVYAQWQQGFKAGGFNPFQCGDAYDPEKVTAFEAGYKMRTADNSFSLNLTGFYNDYTDLQVFQIVGIATQVENAASATIKGIEIEAVARPSSDLSVDLTASLLDATYDRYSDLDPLNPALGFQDLKGKRLNRAPKYTANVGVEYSLPFVTRGDLRVRGELFFSDDVYFRQFNGELDKQDAYVTANAFVTYDVTDALNVRAFVKNFTNEEYVVGLWTADLTAGRFAVYAPPRTYGVGVGYRF